MKLRVSRSIGGTPAALASPAALATCLGLRLESVVEEASGRAWEVVVLAPLWRELQLRLRVELVPGGLAWTLVEGDLIEVGGRVWVHPIGAGQVVSWEQSIELPIAAPPALALDYEQVLVPAWLERIAASPLP